MGQSEEEFRSCTAMLFVVITMLFICGFFLGIMMSKLYDLTGSVLG